MFTVRYLNMIYLMCMNITLLCCDTKYIEFAVSLLVLYTINLSLQ